MNTVGIEDISAYCGRAVADVAEIISGRSMDIARIGNLTMKTKGVALPCEEACHQRGKRRKAPEPVLQNVASSRRP